MDRDIQPELLVGEGATKKAFRIKLNLQSHYIPPQGAAVFSYFEPHQIRVLSPAINFLKTEFRGHLDLGIPCQKHRGRHRDNSNTITPDLRILKKLVK